MRRISIALFASLATLAFALPAAAEEPAKTDTTPAPAPPPPAVTPKSIEENNRDFLGKGSFIIGAERVFGFSMTSAKLEGNDARKTTQIGFLWNGPTLNPFQAPRMAIDYVAFDQVTFGGALGVSHISVDGGSSSTDVLFAPRAGYIFGGRGVLSLWARAGFTVWSASAGDLGSSWGTAFNIEPEIIISPYKHLGIYLGGVVDLGMFGKQTVKDPINGTESKLSYNVTNFGVTGGLRAWF
jgi:hypothetical protein